MSRFQRSQDSHSSCSPTNSVHSTDSMDQFCRDFDSSLKVTSEMSLNSATLHLCDNTAGGQPDSYDAEKNSRHGVFSDDGLLQTVTAAETERRLSEADNSPSYEGKKKVQKLHGQLYLLIYTTSQKMVVLGFLYKFAYKICTSSKFAFGKQYWGCSNKQL